jgi:hypothetical protein
MGLGVLFSYVGENGPSTKYHWAKLCDNSNHDFNLTSTKTKNDISISCLQICEGNFLEDCGR